MEPYWDGDCGLVMLVFIVVKSLSCVLLFATPWTVRGVLLASILEWFANSFSRESPDQGLKQCLLHWQAAQILYY